MLTFFPPFLLTRVCGCVRSVEFYLILDVAAGGTSGWFPDSVGGKPWFDSDPNAMYNFASAQDQWAASWPSSSADRAMRV